MASEDFTLIIVYYPVFLFFLPDTHAAYPVTEVLPCGQPASPSAPAVWVWVNKELAQDILRQLYVEFSLKTLFLIQLSELLLQELLLFSYRHDVLSWLSLQLLWRLYRPRCSQQVPSCTFLRCHLRGGRV